MEWSKYLNEDRLRVSSRNGSVEDPIDQRSAFESDFGRAMFCSALRRMHDKTQVIPLTNGDKIHTRLTHSMEVMGIAESLGHHICRNRKFKEIFSDDEARDLEKKIPTIIKTAGLLHDIGNPPFGHFGETIIQEHFSSQESYNAIRHEPEFLDYVYFDGNAQGFRILTKLQFLNDLTGLNLTYATLGTYLKYPNCGKPVKTKLATKKHGVFTTEEDYLNKIIESCGLRCTDGTIKRHPLSFLVEAADSICYYTMDIEDGFEMGWYSARKVFDEIRNYLIERNVDVDSKPLKRLLTLDENKSDRHNMVSFRINVISYLIKKAVTNFIDNIDAIDCGEYHKELIEDDNLKVVDSLKSFAINNIFNQPFVVKAELTGHQVISGLITYLYAYVTNPNIEYRKRVKQILSKTACKVGFYEEDVISGRTPNIFNLMDKDFDQLKPTAKLRLIIDHISGMTDKYAVTLFQELSGQLL